MTATAVPKKQNAAAGKSPVTGTRRKSSTAPPAPATAPSSPPAATGPKRRAPCATVNTWSVSSQNCAASTVPSSPLQR